ncbi:MAG: gluconokinase [Candidatus Nanopelagicales bacterium]
MAEHQHLVIMGVAGCGKTTVAQLLSERLGWVAAEADDFHPSANIAKMASGVPLTDDDRWPWLRAIRDWITLQNGEGRDSIVTCSALKRGYRDVLRQATGQVRFVHLDGTIEVIGERIQSRSKHFMPPRLLPSQFEILEPLGADEDGVVVPVAGQPESIADDALRRLEIAPNRTA